MDYCIKRFNCPRCGVPHALAATPHVLRNVAPGGELFCKECGESWIVAINASGVVPREGDEVTAWLANKISQVNRPWPEIELLEDLLNEYLAHARRHISLEESIED
jgi:hypothetical protein